MNIPPSETAEMGFQEYQELLWNWNDSHSREDDADAPDPEIAIPILEAINSDPRLTH